MRFLAVLLTLAAAALAQVPTHSVSGSLTLDVIDTSIPVPYGTTETKAVISVCDTQEYQRFQITPYVQDHPGSVTAYGQTFDVTAVQVGTLYCASIVVDGPRSAIPFIDVAGMRTAGFTTPPNTPAVSAAKVRK